MFAAVWAFDVGGDVHLCCVGGYWLGGVLFGMVMVVVWRVLLGVRW